MPKGPVAFRERDIRRLMRAAKKEGGGRVQFDLATGKAVVDVRSQEAEGTLEVEGHKMAEKGWDGAINATNEKRAS